MSDARLNYINVNLNKVPINRYAKGIHTIVTALAYDTGMPMMWEIYLN